MVQHQSDLVALMLQGCEDFWAWNKKDKSHEVKLLGSRQQTAHFHPKWSNGTAGVRGTRCLNYGTHYWEIKVSQRLFGTSMMFGVGTKKARLHVDAFVNLVGEDEHSWGISQLVSQLTRSLQGGYCLQVTRGERDRYPSNPDRYEIISKGHSKITPLVYA